MHYRYVDKAKFDVAFLESITLFHCFRLAMSTKRNHVPETRPKLHLLDIIKKQEALTRKNAIVACKKQEVVASKNGKEIMTTKKQKQEPEAYYDFYAGRGLRRMEALRLEQEFSQESRYDYNSRGQSTKKLKEALKKRIGVIEVENVIREDEKVNSAVKSSYKKKVLVANVARKKLKTVTDTYHDYGTGGFWKKGNDMVEQEQRQEDQIQCNNRLSQPSFKKLKEASKSKTSIFDVEDSDPDDPDDIDSPQLFTSKISPKPFTFNFNSPNIQQSVMLEGEERKLQGQDISQATEEWELDLLDF